MVDLHTLCMGCMGNNEGRDVCPHCGYEYVLGLEDKKRYDVCPLCGKPTKEVCLLTIGKSKIALEPDKYLYKSHIDKYTDDYSTVVGRVIRNKKNPTLWGIKLALGNAVEVEDASGDKRTIAADGVIPIVRNLKIRFGSSLVGEIK